MTVEVTNNDRGAHGYFSRGNSVAQRYREHKAAWILQKANEVASQFGGYEALEPIDVGRVKLIAKHLYLAEYTADANQCTRSTRASEMLLAKIKPREPSLPGTIEELLDADECRAAKYKRTIRTTARQLGVPPSSELARHVSLLQMAREQMEIRLIDGRGDLDPNHLLRIDDALRQYLPAAEPAGVQLVINAARLCHRCKAELEAQPPPVAEERPSPPPSKPPASLNVVPLKQPQRTIDNGAP